MKSRIALSAIILATFTAQIQAQNLVTMGNGSQVVQPSRGYVSPPQLYPPPISPSFDQWGNPVGPAIVTGNQFNGFNSQTGGIDTANQQVDHSAFRAGREESKFNGSYRHVRRPIYDTAGQVVGYQEGYVWNNNVTGEEHGDLQNYTPNSMGGVHQGSQMKSSRPNNNRGGVHTQQHSYGQSQVLRGNSQQGRQHNIPR